MTLSLVATVFGDQQAVSIDACFAGSVRQGVRATSRMAPRNVSTLLQDTRRERTYVNWQKAFDDPRRYGRRSYWKSLYVDELTTEFEDAFEEMLRTAPSPHTMLTFDHLHGKTHRIARDETAFSHRDKTFLFLINANWEDASEDAANISWTRKWFEVLSEVIPSTSYLNYLSIEGEDRILSAYGSNQNILPAY